MGKHKEVKCVYCADVQRVLTFDQLKSGDHICLGGGRRKNVFNRQFAIYKHHALIKSLIQRNTDGSSAMIKMIHFIWTPFSKSIEIRETTETKNLYNDEIYRYIYRFPVPLQPIMDRANILLRASKTKNYSFLTYNCEHMVRWCIAGSSKSLQVDLLVRNIMQWSILLPSFIGKIIFAIKSRPNLQSDIRNIIFGTINRLNGKDQNVNTVAQTAVVTLGGMTFINLLMCIYRTCRFWDEFHQSKQICRTCYTKKTCEIWLTFSAYAISNLGFGLLNFANTMWLPIRFFWGSIIMSIVTFQLARNAFVGFKRLNRGCKEQIKDLSKLQKGDVISYHSKKKLVGILSNIVITEGVETEAKVKLIYSSWPSIISRRKIEEQSFTIKIIEDKHDQVWRYDYSGYNIHNPDKVISRAKSRIGETKIAFFSDSGSHFCYWAKVDETPNTNDNENINANLTYERILNNGDENLPQVYIDHHRGKPISTSCYEKRVVRVDEDIKEGDMIEIKFNYHKAICMHLEKKDQAKVEMTYVYYNCLYKLKKKKEIFDLNRYTINVYSLHPVHRYSRQEIVNRVNAIINGRESSTISRGAIYCADEIVRRGENFEVIPIKKISKGDVIIYRYRGLLHEAVVSGLPIKDVIKIVHYKLRHVFTTGEIIEEDLPVKNTIRKKTFNGYYTYSKEETLTRALSRINEKRFSVFGNTSSDFVHWCKVVQTQTVYSIIPVANNEPTQVVVIPLTGQFFQDSFRKNWIKSTMELTEGSVIKVRGQFGIVWSINNTDIKLVNFSPSTSTVTKTDYPFNIKTDKECIWIYTCDPRTRYTAEVIKERASACIGRKSNIPLVKSAWEFCKWCVLKDYPELFFKHLVDKEDAIPNGSFLEVEGQFGILESKTDTQIHLVCYNQFQNTIYKDTFEYKKHVNDIYSYCCNPSRCNERDVILKRASTWSEKENNIPAVKSAWEFCKWCVLKEHAE